MADNGREFWGRPAQHPYELFLQLEEIGHRTTRVKHPQSNSIVERFHRTLLDEHFRVAALLRALYSACGRSLQFLLIPRPSPKAKGF